jgi:hypothetical protein
MRMCDRHGNTGIAPSPRPSRAPFNVADARTPRVHSHSAFEFAVIKKKPASCDAGFAQPAPTGGGASGGAQ